MSDEATTPFTADDLTQMLGESQFQSAPPEERSQMVENGLDLAYQDISQSPEWGPEAYKAFGDFAQAARAKAASLGTIGESLTGSVDDFGSVMVNLGRGLEGAVYAPGDALPIAGANLDAMGSRLRQGQANLQGGRIYMDQQLGQLKNTLDNPSTLDPEQLTAQLQKHNGDLVPVAADYYSKMRPSLVSFSSGLPVQTPANPDPNPTPEEQAYALANGLQSPQNAALISQYMRTRNPAVFEQLRKNLLTPPERAAALAKASEIARNSQRGKDLAAFLAKPILGEAHGSRASTPGVPLHEEIMHSAGDPINLASYIVPMLRAAPGKAGLLRSLALGHLEGQLFAESQMDPNATLAEHWANMKRMFAMTLGMQIPGSVLRGLKAARAGSKADAATKQAALAKTAEAPPLPADPLDAAVEKSRRVIEPPPGSEPIVAPEPAEGLPPPAKSLDLPPPSEKSSLEKWADDTIASGRMRMNSLPVDVYSAYVVKSAYMIARGTRDFASWSVHMLRFHGQDVAPYLKQIWKAAHENPIAHGYTGRVYDNWRATAYHTVAGPNGHDFNHFYVTMLGLNGNAAIPFMRYLYEEAVERRPINGAAELAHRQRNAATKAPLLGEAGTVDQGIIAQAQHDLPGLPPVQVFSSLGAARKAGIEMRTLPEKVWQALTAPNTKRFWFIDPNGHMVILGNRVPHYPNQSNAHLLRNAIVAAYQANNAQMSAAPVGPFRKLAAFYTKMGQIAPMTAVKKAGQRHLGGLQRSVASVREIMREVEHLVPDPLKRVAITNWLEAGGDAAKLRLWAAKSRGPTAKFKAGYEAALNLTPDEQLVAARIRNLFDEHGLRFQGHGLVHDWLMNYVTHIWNFDETNGALRNKTLGFAGNVTQNFRHGNNRTLSNFFEGEQQGLKPLTKDISQLLGAYVQEGNKAVLGRQMAEDLMKAKASNGDPLAYLSGNARAITEESAKGTPGAIFVNGHAKQGKLYIGTHQGNPITANGSVYQELPEFSGLRNWKWVENTEEEPVHSKGDLLLHPEAYKYLKPAFGQDRLMNYLKAETDSNMRKALAVTARSVLKAQSFAKEILFSGGVFHIVQEGRHAVGHWVNPFKAIEHFEASNAEHADMVNHGLMIEADNLSRSHFMEAMGTGRLAERIPGYGQLSKFLSDFTFQDFIPSLKIRAYRGALRRNLKRFSKELQAGTATESDIKFRTANEINEGFGHLNHMEQGWGKTGQRFLRTLLLAPDFLEARARFAIRALNDLAHGRLDTEQAMAFAMIAGQAWVVTRIMNALANKGDSKADSWDHLFAIEYDNRFYSTRSVPEDLHALITNWSKFVTSRIAPYAQTIVAMVFKRNNRGEEMSRWSALEDTLLRHIPISLRWAADYSGGKLAESIPGGADIPVLHGLLQSSKRNPVSPYEQLLGAIGLHVSRHSPINDVHKMATRWLEAHGQAKPAGVYPVSQYQQLRYALEDNDPERANAEFRKLLADAPDQRKPGIPVNTAKRNALVKGFHASLFRAWTGSAATDALFAKSLPPDDAALKSLGDQRRADVWQRFIQAAAIPPALAQHYPAHGPRARF